MDTCIHFWQGQWSLILNKYLICHTAITKGDCAECYTIVHDSKNLSKHKINWNRKGHVLSQPALGCGLSQKMRMPESILRFLLGPLLELIYCPNPQIKHRQDKRHWDRTGMHGLGNFEATPKTVPWFPWRIESLTQQTCLLKRQMWLTLAHFKE